MPPTKDEILKFSKTIETMVLTVGDDSYTHFDAVLDYCEKTGLEIDVAATLISPNLKSKIENVAFNQNMLKNKSRLPI